MASLTSPPYPYADPLAEGHPKATGGFAMSAAGKPATAPGTPRPHRLRGALKWLFIAVAGAVVTTTVGAIYKPWLEARWKALTGQPVAPESALESAAVQDTTSVRSQQPSQPRQKTRQRTLLPSSLSGVVRSPYALLRITFPRTHALEFAAFGPDSVVCEAYFEQGGKPENRWPTDVPSTPFIEVSRYATHLLTVDRIDNFSQAGQWVSAQKDTAVFVLPRSRMLDKDLVVSLYVQVDQGKRMIQALGNFGTKDRSGWEFRLHSDRKARIVKGLWRWAPRHNAAAGAS